MKCCKAGLEMMVTTAAAVDREDNIAVWATLACCCYVICLEAVNVLDDGGLDAYHALDLMQARIMLLVLLLWKKAVMAVWTVATAKTGHHR